MLPQDFLIYIEKYKDKLDIQMMTKAVLLADRAHEGQLRKSGDPYIVHPLNIAKDLLEYNFDTHTVCAAILHDVIEDTHIQENEIEEICGKDVLNLVLGVTKLSKVRILTREEAKVENFRKFILSFIGDIRVLIIKIFDRLDNMRTIMHIPQEKKQRRIAQETLDIYAPLTERISLYEVKDELEDLSFAVLEPGINTSINLKIEELKENTKVILNDIAKEINACLEANNIEVVNFKGRIKKPYSIWKKIQKQGTSFEDIFDIIAFRVITKNAEDCYRVLYALHSKYRAIFSRFKDFISYPKSNNYQSLHTGIYCKNNLKVEIQIRTEDMDNFAENGIASHWNYKNPAGSSYDISQYSWLKNLISILNEKEADLEDIYEYSKLALFTGQIFVFTPKGEIIDLPKDACALDFAYAIHTNIGNKCKSVTIDGVNQPIFTQLKNGQRVEIHTDENQEPQAMWLSFVKTGVAKLSIKRSLKQKHKNTISLQAYSILNYAFEKEGLNFYPELVSKIIEILNIKSENTFFEKVVEGKINLNTIIAELFPYLKLTQEISNKDAINKEKLPIAVKNITFSECCYSVYGDSIVGVVLPSNKLEIHHSSCEILYSQWVNNLNVIRVYWTDSNEYNYKAKLCLEINNEIGSFANISKIFANHNILIDSINSEEVSNSKASLMVYVTFHVKDLADLDLIIRRLIKSKFIKNVERYIN